MTNLGQFNLRSGEATYLLRTDRDAVLLNGLAILPYGVVAEYTEYGETLRELLPWHGVQGIRQVLTDNATVPASGCNSTVAVSGCNDTIPASGR